MKKIKLLVLPVLLVMGFWIVVFSSPVQAFSSGSGVSGDPYVVLTAADLNSVRNNLDAHYIQGADIDLSDYALGSGWEPIGTSGTPFKGTFDGNHYRITGLVINSTASANIGFFGYTSQSTIQNVGLDNIDIKSSASTVNDLGGLVGRGSGTFINNYASGVLETVASPTNSYRVGGLMGSLYDTGSKISNSYSTVRVTSNVQHVGGLVGFLDQNTLIEKSYATGNVSGYWHVGGLTGLGFNMSGFSNSYATGDVQVSNSFAGGLFGHLQIPALYSFAAGKVSGGNSMGAFAGQSFGSVSSYWNKTANPSLPATGFATDSSVGLTESEMKQQVSFVGFDFTDVWGINEGYSYPYLHVFAPVVQVDDLSPTPYQQGSTLTVTGHMRDGSIGQAVTVHYEILNHLGQPVGVGGSQDFTAATGGYEPYSFSVMLDEKKFPGGNYTVNVMAEDAAREVSHERSVAFAILSSNADLNNLTVSSGTLSPSFSSTEDTFILNVGNDITSLTVSAIADDLLAEVEISGMASALGASTHNVGLTVGSNVIPVVVTAQDGSTKKVYTITVTRAGSSDTTVKNLTVSEGVLSPAFASNIDVYTVSVDNTVSSLDVTAIPTDSNATITVNGNATTSDTITLTVGQPTTIPIVVTAQDGGKKTYTVTVQAANIPVTSVTLNLSTLNLTAGGIAGTLIATVNPSNATNQNVTWSSDNLTVASVDRNGVVTPISAGTAMITVTAEGGETATIFVTVKNNSSSGGGGGGESVITYTLTFNTDEGSPVANQTLYYDEKVMNPVVPTKAGYTFAGWYKEATFINEWDFKTDVVRGNTTLYAKWTKNSTSSENPAPIPVQPPEVEVEQSEESTKPMCTTSFTDISSHWAQTEIEDIACRSIIIGYPDGTFRPNKSITREHVALMFTRTFELTPIRNAVSFDDVPTNHRYYDAVTQVYQAGIFDGASNGKFNPDVNMTRAQMAKVLVLAFELQPSEASTNVFQDVSETHWAKDYIAILADNGIALGDDGNFKPEEPVTRAQFVAFMYRALNL